MALFLFILLALGFADKNWLNTPDKMWSLSPDANKIQNYHTHLTTLPSHHAPSLLCFHYTIGTEPLGILSTGPSLYAIRCTVHFYRNIFSVTPRSKVKLVAKMLKAIHSQESKKAAREKAKAVVEELRSMKLKEAAKKVEDGIEETLTYCDFPSEHWTRIRTNNVIERLNREIRRRTRVVGSFPDGNSALMLVCARLRHVAGTQWGNKKYMNMKHLEAALEDVSIAG